MHTMHTSILSWESTEILYVIKVFDTQDLQVAMYVVLCVRVCLGDCIVHCYTEFYRWFALSLSCSPLSDGAPEGDDVGDDEGIMSIAGDHGRLYGATSMGSEMELAPPPDF